MPVDPTIIAALEAALQGDAENVNLRLYLAGMLLESGRAAEALAHYTQILARQPAQLEALQNAALAAERVGETDRAAGYKRLYEALSWDRTKNLLNDPEEARLNETPKTEPQRNSRTSRREIDDLKNDLKNDLTNDLNNDLEDELEDDLEEEDSGRGAGEGRERLYLYNRVESNDSLEDFGEGLWETEKPSMTLDDVAGMVEVKRRLNISFLGPLKNPDMRRLYGKSLRGGLLMYGPPGCGKTYIARATAGEMGARFFSIGLSEVLDSHLGGTEQKLHRIFNEARRHAPCVLFFDELDALGRKRSQMRESWARTYVNQLLIELDSVANNNEGIFVMAATNHPWDIDVALRRPGRVDRTLLVLPPDIPAREAILRANLRERPVDKIDFNWIVGKTEGYSGADVAHLCDTATEYALEDSMERGVARPISQRDFQKALKDVRPSVRSWFDTARHYAQFANEDGVYDDLLKYLKANNML